MNSFQDSTMEFSTVSEETTTNSSSSDNISLRFHIVDYVILVAMLLMSLGIGLYHACKGGRQRTTAEYFKGDKKMALVPVALSMMASYISSNGILGVPAEVYYQGFNYMFTLMGSLIGIPLSVYCFYPVFHDLQVTSVYEYLQKRFNRIIRNCGSILSILTLALYGSFVTYGPALALSQVTGLSVWGSILTTTIIGTIYTSIGGIKAVIWTDAMQLIIFIIALFICIIKGTHDVGGISYVVSKSVEGGRLNPLSFSFDPRVRFTFWGFLISTTIGWTYGYGVCQLQIQRCLSCPTKKAAQKGLWWNIPGIFLVTATYCFLGLVVYVSNQNCDPIKSSQIEAPDQIFPLFVMKTMSALPGLPGVFVAGVFSASLSTTSSVLNSLAAITLEDYVRPFWKNMSESMATNVSKGIAISYGALSLLLIAAIVNIGSIIQAMFYLLGVTYGVEFALFTLGLMVPWCNSKGATLGLICGLAVASWFSLGNQILKPPVPRLNVSTDGCDEILGDWVPFEEEVRPDDVPEIYKISYLWICPIAWFTTMFVGSISSLFIGEKGYIDPKLYSPLVRRFAHKWNEKPIQVEHQFPLCPIKDKKSAENGVIQKNDVQLYYTEDEH